LISYIHNFIYFRREKQKEGKQLCPYNEGNRFLYKRYFKKKI